MAAVHRRAARRRQSDARPSPTRSPPSPPPATTTAWSPRTAAMLMRNNTPRGNAGQMCTTVAEPARTLTTAGHQSLVTWEHLLVPYYGNGTARTVPSPIGTLYHPRPVRPGRRRRRHRGRAVPDAGAARDRPGDELRRRLRRARQQAGEGPPVRQRRHPERGRGHHLRPRRGDHRRGHRAVRRRLRRWPREPARHHHADPAPTAAAGQAPPSASCPPTTPPPTKRWQRRRSRLRPLAALHRRPARTRPRPAPHGHHRLGWRRIADLAGISPLHP